MIVSRIQYGANLAAALAAESVVLVEGFPLSTNEQLLECAARLGCLSRDGITSTDAQPEDRFVHLVRDRGAPALDPLGNAMISTTNAAQLLHTDEHFSANPAKFVLLLCIRQSDTGGDTLIAGIDEIVPKLDLDIVESLLSPIFPSAAGPVPILGENNGRWSVRFNLLEMERALRAPCLQFEAQQFTAIKQFVVVAEEVTVRLRLSPGDCLILRNDLVLHGRTTFPAGSRRLLKRVRVK